MPARLFYGIVYDEVPNPSYGIENIEEEYLKRIGITPDRYPPFGENSIDYNNDARAAFEIGAGFARIDDIDNKWAVIALESYRDTENTACVEIQSLPVGGDLAVWEWQIRDFCRLMDLPYSEPKFYLTESLIW